MIKEKEFLPENPLLLKINQAWELIFWLANEMPSIRQSEAEKVVCFLPYLEWQGKNVCLGVVVEDKEGQKTREEEQATKVSLFLATPKGEDLIRIIMEDKQSVKVYFNSEQSNKAKTGEYNVNDSYSEEELKPFTQALEVFEKVAKVKTIWQKEVIRRGLPLPAAGWPVDQSALPILRQEKKGFAFWPFPQYQSRKETAWAKEFLSQPLEQFIIWFPSALTGLNWREFQLAGEEVSQREKRAFLQIKGEVGQSPINLETLTGSLLKYAVAKYASDWCDFEYFTRSLRLPDLLPEWRDYIVLEIKTLLERLSAYNYVFKELKLGEKYEAVLYFIKGCLSKANYVADHNKRVYLKWAKEKNGENGNVINFPFSDVLEEKELVEVWEKVLAVFSDLRE